MKPGTQILPVLLAAALLLGGSPGTLHAAASPPQLLNYQGVLRDTNSLPLSGSYSMVFRITSEGAGEILVDQHIDDATGVGGILVVNGLFNAQIGSGTILDGSGPGNYSSLGEVFRDFDNVFLTIEVEGELLTPSVPIASVPFALNSTHLDGLDQHRFLRTDVSGAASGNLWFNASPTGGSIDDATVLIKPITAGVDETILGVGVSTAEKFRVDAEGDIFLGGLLNMPNGAQFWDSGSFLHIYGGDSDTDDIQLRAGNSSDDGSLTLVGDGKMELRAGDGSFSFRNGGTEETSMQVSSGGLVVTAGNSPTAGIYLYGGNSATNGSIQVRGGGALWFSPGNGNIRLARDFGTQPVTLVGPQDGLLSVEVDTSLEMQVDQDGDGSEEFRWFGTGKVAGLPFAFQTAELQEDGDFRISGQFENSAAFDIAESFLMVEPLQPGDLVSVDPSRGDAVRLASGIGDTAVIGVVSTKPGVLLGGSPFEPESLREAWGDEVYEEFLLEREDLEQRVLESFPELQRRLASLPHGFGATTKSAPSSPNEHGAQERARMEREVQDRALEVFCKQRFAPVALAGRVPTKVDAGYGSIRVGDLLTTSPTPGHAMRADDPKPGTVIGKALENLDTGTGLIKVLVMLR